MGNGYTEGMPYPDIDPTGVQWRIRSYRDLWEELLAHHRIGRPLVVGIDGHSGSGKTTLANGLAALDRDTAVVHTDDLAWHHSVFGWADLLIDHLLTPVHEGRLPIRYRPSAWVQRDRPGAIAIADGTSALLVEGVGAARRELRPWLDVVVWVHARAEVGRRRVIAKGIDTEDFIDDWMREENDFLAEDRPWEVADVVVAGELGQPALTGRYGNVVTATEPAQVTKREP
jgi:energy-coupling factor transporter ATP-binding protein EcfA2